jgi:hypothetical protein
MNKLITRQNKAMLASYARSFLAAALAVYISGNTDIGDIVAAGIAAAAPPLLRWLNKNDPAFGRGSK